MRYVSVIVATYNRPHHLRECLTSILASLYPVHEVLVMDQSEGTETREVVASFEDQRLQYFHVQPRGKSRSLNLALRASNGEILCFTDDDCVATPGWVQAVVEEFEADSRLTAVFGQTLPKLQAPDARIYATFVSPLRRVFTRHRNPYDLGGAGGNMAYTREAIARIGDFDEVLGPGAPFEAVEDNDYMYRAIKLGAKAVYSPKALVYHEQRLDKWGVAQRLRVYRLGDGAFIAKCLLKLDPWPLAFYLKWQAGEIAKALLARDLPYLKHCAKDFRLTLGGVAAYARWRSKGVLPASAGVARMEKPNAF